MNSIANEVGLYMLRTVCEINKNYELQKNQKTNKQKQKKLEALGDRQTSLAEADHYSNIVHCKNVEPCW